MNKSLLTDDERRELIKRQAAEIERLLALLRSTDANRYWEGRWREDRADRLRTALKRLLATINPGNVDEHEPGCGCVIHEARRALSDS